MTSKQLKHSLFNKTQRDFWKNLHVNIDSYCDKWDDGFFIDFKKKLKWLETSDVKNICNHFGINKTNNQAIEIEFYKNTKACIEFYCVMIFAFEHNPKVICQLLKIPIENKTINKRQLINKVFKHYVDSNLQELFLKYLEHKSGTGYFNFQFNKPIFEKDFVKVEKIMKPLISLLKRHDKKNKIYHFRHALKGSDKWIFLLLKETRDSLIPAIPDNIRLLKGDYIFITIFPKKNKISINTRSQNTAYKIRNYIQSRIENQIYHKRESATYYPKKFFKSILETGNSNDKTDLKLVDVRFRTSEIDSSLAITDPHHKNNIIEQLKTFKDKSLIKLEDFSEFKYLSFYYKGLQFKVNIEMNKWGSYRIHLLDKNKPVKELNDFKLDFENAYKVPFDTYLKNADTKIDEKRITRHILNKNTLDASLPETVENVLLTLIKQRIIVKPSKTSKRKCTNTNCRKYTWEPGDCPNCGNELRIEGDFIDLKFNKKGIFKFVFELLKSNKEFSVIKIKKQIQSAKFDLIDLIDNKGNPLTIYISYGNVPEKIINYYSETANPLLIILSKFKGALQNDIRENGFECIDLADLFSYRNDQKIVNDRFGEYIKMQKRKWQVKLINKGLASFQRISNKPENYSDQDFEIDIYNMLHEMFMVGDRLGGKFAGVAAPDGIISIHNGTQLQRYCLAWDCKYSITQKGYQLADKVAKHRKYINDLKKNDKVLFFGGLKTYAIISQNMDFKKYESFYLKMTNRFRWKGSIVYIAEEHLLKIYSFYKENSNILLINPTGFYKPLHRLILKIHKRDSIPYQQISDRRLELFFDEIENNFSGKRLKFEFNRNEF